MCKDFEENIIHWATGYYKNFRIWDGNNASPNILAQYDTFYPDLIYRVSAIKYYFPMTNKYISNNRVIDPKNKEEFVIAHGKYYFRKYNFCSTFDILEAQKKYGTCNFFKNEFIDGKEDTYYYLGCNNDRCERCWCPKITIPEGDGFYNCRKCKVGSFLTSGYHCAGIGSYFFKSPNLLNRNLDAKVNKITLIENKPAVTVTFWCKTFGFAGDDHIVMFKIGENLEIVFSSSDDDPVRPYGLSVVIDNRLISNVFDFRNQIGDWVFFSIAHHKEIEDYGTVFFPTMMKFELQSQSYPVNISNVNTKMNLDSFTIKKDYFGLVANVKFYDEYKDILSSQEIESIINNFIINLENFINNESTLKISLTWRIKAAYIENICRLNKLILKHNPNYFNDYFSSICQKILESNNKEPDLKISVLNHIDLLIPRLPTFIQIFKNINSTEQNMYVLSNLAIALNKILNNPNFYDSNENNNDLYSIVLNIFNIIQIAV